jgi:ABC-type branched-subunit amino acid transport system ATPase component
VTSSALLEARDVTVRYEGLVAVDGVSLSVEAGEIVGLIGPNGAGKTTMLGALSGFLRPHGRVLLGGRDVTGWEPERRATLGMARTFQRLELFTTMTVFENLLVAAESRFAEAAFVLDLAGRRRTGKGAALAGRVLERIGLEPVAGRLAGEVPLGIGRLVEIGRALCTQPRLLLLDEPAGGLDEGETARLQDVLATLAREDGLGVLLVEHDLRLVMELCDRVAVMDFGRLIAQGTPLEVRDDPAVQAAYFGQEVSDAGAARG